MECPDQTNLGVCLDCLKNGRMSSQHQHKEAKYYVYDKLSFPLFMEDWTAREEILLIQGIMKCGLGNWNEISIQHVKSKQPKECEDHYYAFYNKSKEDYLPNEDDFIISTST